MDFDFSLVLVVLVLVCGAITLLDVLFLSKRRQGALPEGIDVGGHKSDGKGGEKESDLEGAQAAPMPAWIEYPRSFFPVLLIVLLLRSFLVEPFKIPSGSMLPTLRIGDYILVNKYTYGLRLPVLGTKIVSIGDPQRGDIMVFKYPVEPKVNYIKRVIGVPGDKIAYHDKRVILNGQTLPYEIEAETNEFTYLQEQIGEVKHAAQLTHTRYSLPDEWEVPEGHYFVMGDNRDNSLDSRAWGFVPESHIVGKAFAIWMHMPGYVPTFSRNGSIE